MRPFDVSSYKDLSDFSRRELVDREVYERIGHELLREYEGFERVVPAPALRGIPFDYLGFKEGTPHLIIYRDPVNIFRAPSDVLICRIAEIMRRIEGLEAVLIQVSVQKGTYRAMYMEELTRGRKMRVKGSPWREESLAPIVDWVRSQI